MKGPQTGVFMQQSWLNPAEPWNLLQQLQRADSGIVRGLRESHIEVRTLLGTRLSVCQL